MPHKPNIIIVVLDTVRAQNCSCYGYVRNTTPNLDQLAAEGKIYRNAIAPAPWTLPVHASLFTGHYCFRHRVDGRRYRLGDEHTLLTEVLKQEGYNTAGISSNVWISDTFGFHRSFDYFHKTWQLFQNEIESVQVVKLDPDAAASTASRVLSMMRTGKIKTIVNAFYAKLLANRHDDGAAQVTQKAIGWLQQLDSRPFFLFLNYIDPHAPYLAPHPHRQSFASTDLTSSDIRRFASLSRKSKHYHMGRLTITDEEFTILRDLYDEEILYTDAQLGMLVDYLRRNGELDNTFLIVLGDHGENIGEHGLMAHRFSLHQTLLRVPFVMRYPNVVPSGVEHKYVQLTDVMPTILSAVGRSELIAELKLHGIDLLTDYPHEQRPVLAEYLSTNYTAEARSDSFDFQRSRFNRTMRAFYRNQFKLVESQVDDRHELYNLETDPLEGQNIAKTNPQIVSSMQKNLSQFLQQHGFEEMDEQGEELDVDNFVEGRLKALGYLG